HLVDIYPAPLQRIGELVEHVEIVQLLGEPAGDLRPAIGGRRRVVDLGAVLARPRPARAHLVPLPRTAHPLVPMQPAESAERGFLPHFPLGTLDELKYRDVETLIPCPKRHAERSGRLALARAGVHGEQWRVAPGAGRQAVVGDGERLALWHPSLL